MVGPLSDGIVVKTKGETVDKSCDKSIDPVDALKVTGKDWVEGEEFRILSTAIISMSKMMIESSKEAKASS
jgi:hypothetical protein